MRNDLSLCFAGFFVSATATGFGGGLGFLGLPGLPQSSAQPAVGVKMTTYWTDEGEARSSDGKPTGDELTYKLQQDGDRLMLFTNGVFNPWEPKEKRAGKQFRSGELIMRCQLKSGWTLKNGILEGKAEGSALFHDADGDHWVSATMGFSMMSRDPYGTSPKRPFITLSRTVKGWPYDRLMRYTPPKSTKD